MRDGSRPLSQTNLIRRNISMIIDHLLNLEASDACSKTNKRLSNTIKPFKLDQLL